MHLFSRKAIVLVLAIALVLALVPFNSVQAATSPIWVAQTPSAPTQLEVVYVYVNASLFSDPDLGDEEVGLEYRYSTEPESTSYFDYGEADATVESANYRLEIPVRPAGSYVEYQLFIKSQTGDHIVKTGFNWNYTVVAALESGPVKNETKGTYYTTIQSAINAASNGNTISVSAGTYAELVTINKPLTLVGPNAGKAGSALNRTAEATIVFPDGLTGNQDLVTVTAADVTIDGFMLDGQEILQGLTPSWTEGIYSEGNNLKVKNNIIKNFTQVGIIAGVQAYAGPYFSGAEISNNLVTSDVGGFSFNYSGFYVQGTTGIVTNNVIENASRGLQIQPYKNVGVGAVSGNTIRAYRTGLYFNYSENTDANWAFSNNQITAIAAPANAVYQPTSWEALLVETFESGVITFTGNTIDASGSPLVALYNYREINLGGGTTDPAVAANNTFPTNVRIERGGLIIPDMFVTIQSAVNASSSGDTLLVGAGTYPENVLVTDKKINITGTLGSGGAHLSEIIGSLHYNLSASMVDNVLIENLKFTAVAGKDSLLLENFNGGNVLNNIFDGSGFGANGYLGISLVGGSNNGNDNILIEDNTFSNGHFVAIGGYAQNVTVRGNSISGVYEGGINLQGGGGNLVVDATTITVAAKAANMYVYGVRFGSSDVPNLTIQNSTITVDKASFVADAGHYHAAVVTRDPAFGILAVNNSNILGDVLNLSTTLLDANNNWWGQATGPAVGQVTGNVSHCVWLGDDAPSTVFVNGGAVINDRTKVVYCTIQAAIDSAMPEDTLLVAAGNYTEDLEIGKSITILGPNTDISPNTGTRVAEAIVAPLDEVGVADPAVNITASGINVTVRGLTFDMHNTTDANDRFVESVSKTNIALVFENNQFLNAPSCDIGNWNITGVSAPFSLTLKDNYFYGSDTSNGITMWDSPRVVVIKDNVWKDNQGWVVNFNLVTGTISNNLVLDLGENGPEWSDEQAGFLFAEENHITFTNNVMDGLPNSYVRLYSSFKGELNGTGNIFKNTEDPAIGAIRIGNDGVGADLSGVKFEGNSFLNNTISTQNLGTTTLNASGNWWGTAVPALVKLLAGANVDFTPWLDSGVDTELTAIGFQGNFNTLHVDDDSPQMGTVGPIQEAVNIVSGSTVLVEPGNYPENILIDKYVQVIGSGSGNDPKVDSIVITPTTFDTKVGLFNLAVSGTSTDPILLQNMQLLPAGQAGISVGRFTEATGTTADFVKIDNLKVIGTNTNPQTEQERGLYVDLTSTLSNVEILNSSFDNLHYGFYFQKKVDTTDFSTVSNLTMTGGSLSHNNTKGIYAEKLEDATFADVTICQNGYDGTLFTDTNFQPNMSGVDINLKAGNYQNIKFVRPILTGNALGGAQHGVAIAIKARSDGTTYGNNPATLSGVLIEGGQITGNERGIRIGEPGKDNVGPTDVVIQYNRIYANLQTYTGSDGSAYGGLINVSTAPISAENNWWGCNEGPNSGTDCDQLTTASTSSITANPWLRLTATVDKTSLNPLETLKVGASLRDNSDGLTPSNTQYVPNTTPVGFTATTGTLATTSTTTLAGLASSTYTAKSTAALDNLCVIVDNETVCQTVSISPALNPGSMGYWNSGSSGVLGVSAGFHLERMNLTGVKSLVVELYGIVGGNEQVRQTNTAILAGGKFDTFTSFSSPFDIFGTFNYASDGYWTNVRAEGEFGQSVEPSKAVATLTLANDTVLTATDIGLTNSRSMIILGSLVAEDFGYWDQSGVLGASAGFNILNNNLTDASSMVVRLYGDAGQTVLLQTDTANLTGILWDDISQFSAPFDIFGEFDYVADGYWTNVRAAEYGQTTVPVCAVAEVTLFNGNTITAENCNLTGTRPWPIALDDNYSTNEEYALTISTPGLLSNDIGFAYAPITLIMVDLPLNGTLSPANDGSYLYTPVSNYNGEDSFTYKLSEGVKESNVATVTISVTAVNDAPVAEGQSVTTTEDKLKTITPVATDVDLDALTFIIKTSPAHGTVEVVAGVINYTPALNYYGPDSFTFAASDGLLESAEATVEITVASEKDNPMAGDDFYLTNQDTQLVISAAEGVLKNDSDIDLNERVVTLVTGVTKGVLTLNENGSFTYTPNPGVCGVDTFTYRLVTYMPALAAGWVDDALVTITVNCPPTLAPISDQIAYVGQQISIQLDASDPDGDNLTFSMIGASSSAAIDAQTMVFTDVAYESMVDSEQIIHICVSDDIVLTPTCQPVKIRIMKMNPANLIKIYLPIISR